MAKLKLTPELTEEICQHIREGNTITFSYQKAGISKQTFYNWMNKGEESKGQKGVYFDFFDAIKKAREEGKNNLVKGIKAHGKNSWQALAWLLERMYPNEFGKMQRVEMEHSGEVKQKTESKVEVKHDIPEHLIPVIADIGARIDTEKDKPGESGTD